MFALLHQRVFGEMPRMAFRRIAAPIDDEIGPVFNFTQRTSNFATQLSGDLGRTMSQRGMAIEQSSQQVGQCHTFFLRFTGGVTHAVDQRHVGFV